MLEVRRQSVAKRRISKGPPEAAARFCSVVCPALGMVLLCLTTFLVGQEDGSEGLPKLTLILPSGVGSETVQISYFMTGSFGGYGSYVRTEKKRRTYKIEASVEGKPATSIKLLAYFPGCEILAIDIPTLRRIQEQQLSCKPLGQLPLHGQILPASITKKQRSEIEVAYLADWDHRFFGIADGMVTRIRVGAVVPDANGRFEVNVPDFDKQTNLGDGEFQFILRQRVTSNTITLLKPSSADTVKVSPSYPSVVFFKAEKQ